MSVASATTVRMPRLSDSMEEGTIVRWLKVHGGAVRAGEAIVEIETDKATMEYEAEADGVLEIVVHEGDTVALGEVIAQIVPGEVDRPTPPPRRERPNRIRATPLARRLAAERGIELATVHGTGRRGHVVKADVEALAANGIAPEPAPEPAPAVPPEPAPVVQSAPAPQRQELTRVQQRIASRMAQSRATVPNFELEVEVDMDACLKLRAELPDHADPVPSINDMVIRACALALAKHPRVNGSYRDDGFDLHDEVNVGFAVAAPDALLVPVIRDANRKSVVEIAHETRALATKARDGSITPSELSGATFTISNLGMFGITRFTAVINPPQSAILAVGAVQARAVVRDGELAIAHIMSASLASDHRILYGADAARFLVDVRERLQAPIGLLV
ncbi:MAG: 2-oxo acid dehydrogenase subunit E2 [Solirubrobacterales bacterium]|nr:2-oxo acid dehydrogenase subunit E2 [Solirubrobacterales bacterium]